MSAFALHVAGTVLPDRTVAAVRPPEQHGQSRLTIGQHGLPPWTAYPLWTSGGLSLPANVKVFLGEAGSFDGTPVLAYRPDDSDPMIN